MIGPVTQVGIPATDSVVKTQSASSNNSFSNMLTDALDQTEKLEIQSNQAGQQLAAGQGQDIHSVMIAAQKAELAIQLTVQVRNKAVEAYQEVMRMQV